MARRTAPAIPDEMLDQLLSGASASTAFDRGGLLDQLKKALAERALNAEMDHHLGGEAGAGNSRNGYGRKTVLTDGGGRIALEVPRDRQGSFDPQLIAKYQRRFPGFDEKIVSLYARGLSTREIAGHVLELCGSRLKLAIGSHDGPLGASSHAIVWANSPTSRRLHGLFLPSLRRFVIATNPAAATSPYPGAYRVVLSSGDLYVIDESGRVFATRAPTQRHRLARTTQHH